MKNVNILVNHGRFTNNSDFFFLYRWKNKLKEYGIKIKFFYKLKPEINDADTIILSSRYFKDWQKITIRNKKSDVRLKTILKKLSINTNKLIWFDVADTTGSTDFGIIPYVDLFLKKQLLKDKTKYMIEDKDIVRTWLPSQIQNEYKKNTSFHYSACPMNEIDKLKVSWNIGFNDYRNKVKYLNRFSIIFPYVFNLKISDPISPRYIFIINRGNINSTNKIYSYQRNISYYQLEKLKNKFHERNIITHGFVKRSKYYNELSNSKIATSPFGWGEICYKDFEIILSGAMLLKPSMLHLTTFPNIYDEYKTYIPLKWDMSDIEEVIVKLFDNPNLITDISNNAQKLYADIYNNAEHFCKHFSSLV